jgi:hypothetical protein
VFAESPPSWHQRAGAGGAMTSGQPLERATGTLWQLQGGVGMVIFGSLCFYGSYTTT